MVARGVAAWSSESPGIPRRSWNGRRPGDVDEARVDFLRETKRNRVKEVRKEMGRKKKVAGSRGVAVFHRNRARRRRRTDGTAGTNPSSLGALGEGFLGQMEEEREGYKGGKVGGGGVRHNAGNRRGAVRPFRPLKATGVEETMTSC